MSYRRERADKDNHATHAARSLPGDLSDNLSALMRLRAQRITKLRGLGFTSEEIFESLGLTYRQQHYALRWEARHAVQG